MTGGLTGESPDAIDPARWHRHLTAVTTDPNLRGDVMKTTTTENPRTGLGFRDNPRPETSVVRRLSAWCIAHRRRVFASWVAVAVLTTAIAGAVGRQLRHELQPAGNRVAARASTCWRRSSRRRAATSTRSSSTSTAARSTRPRCGRRSTTVLAQVSTCPARGRRDQPVPARRRGRGLARSPDGVRDDQLRQAREPAAERDRQAGARSRSRRCTCRALRSPPAVR